MDHRHFLLKLLNNKIVYLSLSAACLYCVSRVLMICYQLEETSHTVSQPSVNNFKTKVRFERWNESFRLELAVITYNRPESLQRLLNSLSAADYRNDSVTLKICVDREKKHNTVSNETVLIANSFPWPHGEKTVHVRSKHVGPYIQWYDCWRPSGNPGDFGLILEDDLELSPYFYRWLKPALLFYQDNEDVGAISLQKPTLVAKIKGKHTTKKNPLCPECKDSVFLYRLPGSWGYAPMPKVWVRFREWVFTVMQNESFVPYITSEDNIVTNTWLKHFHGKSMPTSYYIYFNDMNHLYTLYINLHVDRTLSCNRREPGMHYKHDRGGGTCDFKPLDFWNNLFIYFPRKPVKLNWAAQVETSPHISNNTTSSIR